MRVIILSALLAAAFAQTHDPNADAQYINFKAVKGGGGGQYHYRGGDNFNRFHNNTQGYGVSANHSGSFSANQRVGICIVEVPTATLARDPKHVPAGNGSRSDLSRIETCCAGYIRNIHNFRLCDPVCTTECVNALCTAPNTCTCFPDHVKNNAGFCVATCPIGCQNGHCAGGECLCKEGFKLDRNGRFCEPYCRDNCGGNGNCTAPNTCSCKPGFHSTPEGSCREGAPSQQQPCGSCVNGDCAGTECRCRQGYLLYKGECLPLCYPSCGPNTKCVAPNVCSTTPAANQPNITGQFPNQVTIHNQYPYPNQPQNNPYGQNQGQYPGQYPQNPNSTNIGQYPYPSQNPYGQNPNKPPSSVYAQYPGGQPNQYPQQPGQYPQQPQPNPNQPNQGQHPHQPGQQHLYPVLPQNQYPYPNQPNKTDGQVFHQTMYNPLENQTFNLHQGQDHTQGSQGQHGAQGQFTQGQNGSDGQISQGQYGSDGQVSQGQYGSNGQFSQGQYGSNGQFSQGQYGSSGQFGQAQQGAQGQYSSGQYGSQGQYNQGQHESQGQYGHGQLSSQGQSSQGQHGQVEVYGHPGQFVPQGQDQTLNWPNQGQCAQPCVNGTCVGGNRCECLPGYVQDPADATGTRCQPYCYGGCHNGFCTAPNTCVCDAGYHKDFSVKGRSLCIKRERRSIEEKPINVAELLVFEIPEYAL